MNLNPSEEDALLQHSAERFLKDEYSEARRKRIVGSPEGFSRAIWQAFADFGWLALPLAEADGGLGCKPATVSLLMQAFGRSRVVEPYLPTVLMAAAAISKLGDASQRWALLPAVVEGRSLLAFAHSEPRLAFASTALNTRAVRTGDGWRLSGRKSLVLGASADAVLVSARIAGADQDRAGIGLFVVPTDAMTRSEYALVDDRRAADIELAGVALGAEALLGRSDDALPAIEAVLDGAANAQCADAVGVAEVLLAATIDYTKTRVQFGKPIGSFQVLQHRIADMAVLLEEARSSLLLAVLSQDGDAATRARATSSAKAKIGRGLRFIAQQSVQMHGAMGVTEELSVGGYFKRAVVFEALFGTTDFHLRRYAHLAQNESLRASPLAA